MKLAVCVALAALCVVVSGCKTNSGVGGRGEGEGTPGPSNAVKIDSAAPSGSKSATGACEKEALVAMVKEDQPLPLNFQKVRLACAGAKLPAFLTLWLQVHEPVTADSPQHLLREPIKPADVAVFCGGKEPSLRGDQSSVLQGLYEQCGFAALGWLSKSQAVKVGLDANVLFLLKWMKDVGVEDGLAQDVVTLLWHSQNAAPGPLATARVSGPVLPDLFEVKVDVYHITLGDRQLVELQEGVVAEPAGTTMAPFEEALQEHRQRYEELMRLRKDTPDGKWSLIAHPGVPAQTVLQVIQAAQAAGYNQPMLRVRSRALKSWSKAPEMHPDGMLVVVPGTSAQLSPVATVEVSSAATVLVVGDVKRSFGVGQRLAFIKALPQEPGSILLIPRDSVPYSRVIEIIEAVSWQVDGVTNEKELDALLASALPPTPRFDVVLGSP